METATEPNRHLPRWLVRTRERPGTTVQGCTLFTLVFFPDWESASCRLLTLMENLSADMHFPKLSPAAVSVTDAAKSIFPEQSVPAGQVEGSRSPLRCSEPSHAATLCPPQICSNDPCRSTHPTGHASAPRLLLWASPLRAVLPCALTVGAGGEPARYVAFGSLGASLLLWHWEE